MNFSRHSCVESSDLSRSNLEEPSWSGVVQRIRSGDPSAMEELYAVFVTGIRFYLCHQLGQQDVEDRVHDAFLTITQSIRRGALREPDRLMGYIRTILRRQVAAEIETVVTARHNQLDPLSEGGPSDGRSDPENQVIEREELEVAWNILRGLPRRDREVLVRFYLNEQGAMEICNEMGLTSTQFRLIKSRAKQRFGELGRARLALRRGFRPNLSALPAESGLPQ